jgi:hypothetical protein
MKKRPEYRPDERISLTPEGEALVSQMRAATNNDDQSRQAQA